MPLVPRRNHEVRLLLMLGLVAGCRGERAAFSFRPGSQLPSCNYDFGSTPTERVGAVARPGKPYIATRALRRPVALRRPALSPTGQVLHRDRAARPVPRQWPVLARRLRPVVAGNSSLNGYSLLNNGLFLGGILLVVASVVAALVMPASGWALFVLLGGVLTGALMAALGFLIAYANGLGGMN